MVRRPVDDDPCKDCRYGWSMDVEEDENGKEYIWYSCRLDMDSTCEEEPEKYSDYELYARENPREL